MSAEKLSSDEVPHKFAEWLLGMGCPAEIVPSMEKMSRMCRGQYYLVWRSLMEHVQPKDIIRQKRLQVFLNAVKICQERNVYNECDASIVVPEELKLWKQKKELKEKVTEVESSITLILKTQQELYDNITCKIAQRNVTLQEIKDLQRRNWMLQKVSSDLATKKSKLQETKSISDSLCSFETSLDVPSKLENCVSLSQSTQRLPIHNPVASSSIVSSETDNKEREENIMSLVKCRGDALWPHLYERRAALATRLAIHYTTHGTDRAAGSPRPPAVCRRLCVCRGLRAELWLRALQHALRRARTTSRIAADLQDLSTYISGESCELLVVRCEKVRSEARVRSLKALLVELSENSGIFSMGSDPDQIVPDQAPPGNIAAIDKCIVATRDELMRLISALATTEAKINNIKDCLFGVFNSLHNNTAIEDERFRGAQVDFPREPMSVLKQFYTEKCLRTKNDISMEFEASDCSYNEVVDKNPRFVDELRFYLSNFNLEKNRKLVLDSGEKIWIFETLKTLSLKLCAEWATNDVIPLSPSVRLSYSIRELINEVQNINILESIIKQVNTTVKTGFSVDINLKMNKEELILDRLKKSMSENSHLLSKINKTLDISQEDLEFWSEGNLKKYISSNRTVDGKTYMEYEKLYLENIM